MGSRSLKRTKTPPSGDALERTIAPRGRGSTRHLRGIMLVLALQNPGSELNRPSRAGPTGRRILLTRQEQQSGDSWAQRDLDAAAKTAKNSSSSRWARS
jgi:hypothetical protein